MDKPVKLIYILSCAHSGSTLLDLLLGSHSKIEGLGEIDKYHHYWMLDTIPEDRIKYCTCGQKAVDCLFWQNVTAKLADKIGTFGISLQPEGEEAFVKNNYHTFQSVREVSDKEYVCDSSKRYSRLNRFLKSNQFEVYAIHLIRDARGVAYSFKKRDRKFLAVCLDWLLYNLYVWLRLRLNKKVKAFYQVRYEDIVDQPRNRLTDILKQFTIDFEEDQLKFNDQVHHNLGGNAMRRRKGSNEIKKDIIFFKGLSAGEWFVCTLISWPGLLFFKYKLSKEKTIE